MHRQVVFQSGEGSSQRWQDQEVVEKLRLLHPPKEPYAADASECARPELTEEEDALTREVVHQFSEASGGWPSQLLSIHLKEALACGCDLTEQKLVRPCNPSWICVHPDPCRRSSLNLSRQRIEFNLKAARKTSSRLPAAKCCEG